MYKKVFAVLIAAVMILTLFAACGKTPDNDKNGTEAPAASTPTDAGGDSTEPKSDEPSAEPSGSESESASESVTDESQATSEAPTEPSTEKPTEPSTEKPTEPSTEKPTEPSSEPSSEPKQLSADDIAGALAARSSLFSDPVAQSNARRALSEFGIESAWVADSAYYKAAGNFADQILVVKLASSTDAVNVKYCMEEQKDILAEDYADYDDNGTEVPKINNAVIYESGDVLVFCICANSSGARSALAGIVG